MLDKMVEGATIDSMMIKKELMMTNPGIGAYYEAYAELEAAADAFYTAAHKMADLLPNKAAALYDVCDAVNDQVVDVDVELDEVV
jgi:hypothetical protein